MKTMRVPFLQATFVPVILGGVLALQLAHAFSLATFLLTLLGASLIHIATNMFNDYFDFKSGNDFHVKHQNPFAGGGRNGAWSVIDNVGDRRRRHTGAGSHVVTRDPLLGKRLRTRMPGHLQRIHKAFWHAARI